MANSYDRQFHHSYLADNSSSSSLRAPDRGNEAKGINSPETRFLGHESTIPKDGLHSGNNTKRHFMPGTLFADLSLTLLPAAALGFTVAVMCLDKKTVEKEVLAKWNNAITVIASIFPILFASVASRMVFQAARWNLEKGATLNLLEQLIGSRTVGSTLVTQISLGRFNFLGVALLILWSLSPLGSQSALRMLRTRLEPIHANSSVLYYTTDAPSVFRSAELRNSRSEIDSYRSTQAYMQTMYSALLLAPPSAKSNAMDLWGNVKIPKLEVDGDDKGWKNVSSWNSEPDSYSSLVGLPVTNVTQGNTTFSLESSYIDLDCKLNYNISVFDAQEYEWDPHMGGTNNGSIRLRNGTWHGLNSTYLQTVWSIGVDRFVDEYWDVNDRCPSVGEKKDCSRPSLLINETDLHVRPAQLVFESSFRTSPWQYVPSMRVEAICSVYQRYVESRVACSREGSSSPQNCTVTQQRFSRQPHADEGVTSISFPDIWGWVTRGLPEGVKQQSYADNTIRYLNDPGVRSFAVGEPEEDADMLRNVTKEQFGRRLSQLINTYVLLGQLNQYASQGNSDAIANFAPNVTVPVDVSNLEEIYVVHWNWMALFFACCGVLLGSGIVGVVFAHLAAGPEILGYASSAVRDSKYLNLPVDAGEKEALDVTKMIGQQKFKYGYTNAVSEEGRPLMGIALEDQVQGIKRRSSGKGSVGES